MNERITEDFVREHFKKDLLYNQIQFEEQKSKIHKINKLLNNASKSGNGKGRPEFILSGFIAINVTGEPVSIIKIFSFPFIFFTSAV